MESPEQLMMILGAVFLIGVTVLSGSLRKPPRDGGTASKGDEKKHE